MTHILGHDRAQLLLLPEVVHDYVGADNPVRFIDAFGDGLNLAALGFVGTMPKATGRPGYAPADLLKLYIYGYLNRARSSRRLEAETHRNIEVIWLLRHLTRTSTRSPTSAATTARRSGHYSGNSCCCAGATCSAGSFLRSTAPVSRRLTTRTAISRGPRCVSTLTRPTNGWPIICAGWTSTMSQKAE